MSTHSYSRLWIHLIWETIAREPLLDKRAAARASIHLSDYAVKKGIYMKINYFNAVHKESITRKRRLRKSMSFSSNGMDLNGATKETVKTVAEFTRDPE